MVLKFTGEYLFPDAIAHHSTYSPNQIAVVCRDQRITYRELDERTARIANALRARGISKGDKVAIFMQSSLTFYELLWGIVRRGAVVVPLNIMLSAEALSGVVNNSEARLLFTDSLNAEVVRRATAEFTTLDPSTIILADGTGPGSLERLVEGASASFERVPLEPSDSMSILYTSGTTGLPKGSEHTYFARMAYYIYAYGKWFNFDRDSVALCATPLYANGTWMTMLPTLYYGGKVVIMPKFDVREFYAVVERESCSHMFMVPTQFVSLIAEGLPDPSKLSAVKMLISSGQTLPGPVHDKIRDAFTAAKFIEIYGMSEGFGTLAEPYDRRLKPGTVGKPIWLDDIRIIDEDLREVGRGVTGEIVGYGAGLMKGYYRDPERTEASIWYDGTGRSFLRSGDLGHIDEDGYLFVSGRSKDMIKSGGINVYATDIEEVFMKHPAVLEAAAIGIPHERWMETPLLLVRLAPGASVDPEELVEWGNAKLSKYQRVSAVEFREDFPRATYGKIKKADLRAPYWAERDR